ncbi:PilW family protein [Microbacterium cremeum]|uniref:PilW family protein n=1 Tax=Microbacterium cremeum TaxID=2782169 RepID=UPI0018870ABA|nr:hypothetical protein [Microbacterium cremeum]
MTASMTRDDDSGLGLLELIVAVVVSGIVIVAMGMIFINSWRAQEQVVSTTEATNRGQVVASMIERAMRNALYFEVSGTGDVLHVRTSLAGSLRCQAFQLTEGSAPDYGSVLLATDATALPAFSPWKTGIAKQGATAYFAESAGGTLTYTFQIETDASPVSFTGDIRPRSGDDTKGTDGCW